MIMANNFVATAPSQSIDSLTGYIRQEYETQRMLFNAQPLLAQRFLEAQARQIGAAIVQSSTQVQFTLLDRVVTDPSGAIRPEVVPAERREELIGGLRDRLARSDLGAAVRQRLTELESSPHRSIAICAGLLRYATAIYLVYGKLPAGRSVTYYAPEGEEIPTLPQMGELEPASAITASTDAIAEEESHAGDELLVPYVPAARRFYLPQWVAFDDEDHLLVNSVSEAEAHLASMQRFLEILHAAVSLAPYIVADEAYQQKRYGMLGQLINQGRALARYEMREIITEIRRRAGAHDLNRGLSLSLPYLDDQTLKMELHEFEIIPAGRIMFVPAFVVRAARERQAKVAQDTRFSHSTRKYLLAELKMLETAFE
jgi:hypothetical protein